MFRVTWLCFSIFMLTCHRSYFQAIVDRWHHIAVVYDGKTVAVYVDNSKTTLGALTGTLHLQSNAFGIYTKLHIIYLTAFLPLALHLIVQTMQTS